MGTNIIGVFRCLKKKTRKSADIVCDLLGRAQFTGLNHSTGNKHGLQVNILRPKSNKEGTIQIHY